MKIVYLILTHKLAEQLVRLVTVLNTQQSHFFIHVDARAESFFDEAKEKLSHFQNVNFVSKRYRCRWGQFSLIEATISCLETLIKSDIQFDYAFLLSGQDYPIKKVAYIKSFLKSNRGKQFIEYFPLKEKNKWTNKERSLSVNEKSRKSASCL